MLILVVLNRWHLLGNRDKNSLFCCRSGAKLSIKAISSSSSYQKLQEQQFLYFKTFVCKSHAEVSQITGLQPFLLSTINKNHITYSHAILTTGKRQTKMLAQNASMWFNFCISKMPWSHDAPTWYYSSKSKYWGWWELNFKNPLSSLPRSSRKCRYWFQIQFRFKKLFLLPLPYSFVKVKG